MKAVVWLMAIVSQNNVLGDPQTSGGTFSAFSNFNPNTQTFTSGSSQTFSQDTFFQGVEQGLDNIFPGGEGLASAGFPVLGSDAATFDVFSSASGELSCGMKNISLYLY